MADMDFAIVIRRELGTPPVLLDLARHLPSNLRRCIERRGYGAAYLVEQATVIIPDSRNSSWRIACPYTDVGPGNAQISPEACLNHVGAESRVSNCVSRHLVSVNI